MLGRWVEHPTGLIRHPSPEPETIGWNGELLTVRLVGIGCALGTAALCLGSWTTQASRATQDHPPAKDTGTSARPTFVREFSSAEDVRRSHPGWNRTLDIIAGANEKEQSAEVLRAPYAVTEGPGHRVYVSDLAARKVHIFDFGQSKYSSLKDGDRFQRPVALAADRDGNVYVADSGSGTVLVFDSNGKFRRYLKTSKGSESYFEAPWGIAVDPASARIYVCDSPRHMVIVLDRKGHVLALFGKRGGGMGPGEFRYPTQVAIFADEVFILDTGNRRVQVLDRRGDFRREIHLLQSDRRSGLAVDQGKKIYVSDPIDNFVQVYSRDGGLLYSFGQLGNQPGEFQGPSGLSLDSAHCLYVVDANNKRVQVFQLPEQNTNSCRLR